MIDSFISTLVSIKENYFSWVSFPSITPTDIIEIVIIAFLLYHVFLWVKNTRAWNLFKGILIILLFILVAAVFQMSTIVWIAEKVVGVGLVALVVIFQPELRRALEALGRRSFMMSIFSLNNNNVDRFSEKTITELVKASYEMGKVKTGALIVIENEVNLNEFERTGIVVDGLVTSQLLINIFEKNTPLHDGAVLVRGDRIVSATCYLPLSDNMELSKELGTRHRAAVGVSEVSDSLTIVVSEETGKLSIAMNQVLYRNVDPDFLRDKLEFLRSGKADVKKKRFRFRRRNSNAQEDWECAVPQYRDKDSGGGSGHRDLVCDRQHKRSRNNKNLFCSGYG